MVTSEIIMAGCFKNVDKYMYICITFHHKIQRSEREIASKMYLPDFPIRYEELSEDPGDDIWYDFADVEFMEPVQ